MNCKGKSLRLVFDPANEMYYQARRSLYLLDAARECYLGNDISKDFKTNETKAAEYAYYHDAIEDCIDGVRQLLSKAVNCGERAIAAMDNFEGEHAEG